MCFGCSKEPSQWEQSHWDSSFKYPQHVFWLGNKENIFQLRSLIWRSVSLIVIMLNSFVFLPCAEIFLGLIWGRYSAPSQLKNEQSLLKMMHIIPNFLILHFGESFMKIWTKIAKLQMHENLHLESYSSFSYSDTVGIVLYIWFSGPVVGSLTATYWFYLDTRLLDKTTR